MPIHHRKSIRLMGYDYARQGAYFVTICSQNRQNIFGNLVDGKMQLNDRGAIVKDVWEWLGEQYAYVGLDEYVVMPNHFHGIIFIKNDSSMDGLLTCRGGSRIAPTTTVKIKPLGQLIGVFKTVSSKRINQIGDTAGAQWWQRNYYERVIRNESELQRIREYIANNPANWENDKNFVA